MPNVFIVNVFANASHPFVNPLFEDSSFEVVPIPESKKYKGSWIKKYRDLRCFHTGEPLTKYLPNRYHNRHVHDDPDLVKMTYGDVKSPRSGNLEKIMRGDWAVFYALLTPFKNGRPFRKSRAFYIVSTLGVENILRKFPHVTEKGVKSAFSFLYSSLKGKCVRL